MLKLESNFDLTQFNSFGIKTKAQHFVKVESAADLESLPKFLSTHQLGSESLLILGSGSNILFAKAFAGLVLHIATKGKSLARETSTHFEVTAQAGENWHEFVQWCISNQYPGAENLSLIPGTVGAAPVQNIGAYGVELKDICKEVEYFDLRTYEFKKISAENCQFKYRDSIFKHELKDKVIITAVTFLFPKIPNFQMAYGDLAKKVSLPATAAKIAQAVIEIRNEKLPDPKLIGNAGSFFHNPIIDAQKAQNLLIQFPSMPHYPAGENKLKLAAGWLIDQCGWKGYAEGNVGVYEKQALVLINRGGASGAEILSLAQKIQKSVHDKFEIDLSIEPLVL